MVASVVVVETTAASVVVAETTAASVVVAAASVAAVAVVVSTTGGQQYTSASFNFSHHWLVTSMLPAIV